ncbi:acyltransferase family protein [Agrococcus versicolor]|uniref:Acyltransferase family protein n=1 Tax=Agrococcus versicolor TaxID=501482 RepID=A0ABN3AL76_9MICO
MQGLRAIACLLVAAYHVWPGRISGGVDVFFVITGFLVIPGIVQAIDDRGVPAAWRAIGRAIARQLPMAGLVLAVVGLGVLTLWPTFSRGTIALEVLASATWWQNWLLVDRATDYLATGTTPSPLQHFWATSVHVQVVVALVALVLATTLVARRMGRPTGAAVVAVLSVASLLSFWWAQLHVLAEPSAAYFDSVARLWEFGVGALVGLGASRARLTSRARTALGLLGLLLVLLAGRLSHLGDQPGAITLVPVAGALAILLAGTAPGGLAGRLLSWRPLVALGGLSWGLYLWCWPILVGYRLLAPERASTQPLLDGILLIVAAGVASWASTRLIARIDRLGRWRPSRVSTPLVAMAAVVLVATGGSLASPAPAVAGVASVQDAQARIEATIAEGEYPGTEWLGADAQAPEWVVDDCLDVDRERADRCTYGPEDASLHVAVVGDSHAISYLPGLRAALPDARVEVLTRGMCAFSTVSSRGGEDHWATCQAHADWATQRVLDGPIDLVVLANGLQNLDDATDDGVEAIEPSEALARMAEGTVERLAPLVDAGLPVLWLDGAPPNSAYASCALPASTESVAQRCTVARLDHMAARAHAFSAAAAFEPSITVVDQSGWWCSIERGLCPVTIDGMPVTADGNHLTWMLSTAYAPLLAREVEVALRP